LRRRGRVVHRGGGHIRLNNQPPLPRGKGPAGEGAPSRLSARLDAIEEEETNVERGNEGKSWGKRNVLRRRSIEGNARSKNT